MSDLPFIVKNWFRSCLIVSGNLLNVAIAGLDRIGFYRTFQLLGRRSHCEHGND